jgi:hypothetical protein
MAVVDLLAYIQSRLDALAIHEKRYGPGPHLRGQRDAWLEMQRHIQQEYPEPQRVDVTDEERATLKVS